MNKFFWLIGFPAAAVLFGIVAKLFFGNILSSITQEPVVVQALPLQAQPSTIIAIDTTHEKAAGDRIAHPPIKQTFTTTSDQGDAYHLVISAEDDWRSPIAQAKLLQGETVLWEESLPHQYGPRFVLIGNNGNVLLLDEFINVASPHAITLINKKGQTIARYGFKDIRSALDLSTDELTKQATAGWWISAAPMLIDAGNCAAVSTGNKLLEINLITGVIGPRDPSTL